jgi:hypothetical protein
MGPLKVADSTPATPVTIVVERLGNDLAVDGDRVHKFL